jgi:hypothetical protein
MEMAHAIKDNEYQEECGHGGVVDMPMKEHQRIRSSYQNKKE